MKHIKMFDSFLNEAASTPELLEAQDKAISSISELEKLIKKESGVVVKLTASKEKYGVWQGIRIVSADLSRDLGKLGQAAFGNFLIRIDGGGKIYHNALLMFGPEVIWSLPGNKLGNTQFIWDYLWFDINKGVWLPGNTLR
jgi:hypothetical protein